MIVKFGDTETSSFAHVWISISQQVLRRSDGGFDKFADVDI
jgi:hypothetical protein